MVSQTNNKFKIIKENIKALSNQFKEEKLKEEHCLEKKNNYIKVLEKKINERFDEERAKREEEEFKIFNIINNKFNILLNEVNNEIRNRNSCVENLKLFLDSQNKDNPDLTQALCKEKIIFIDVECWKKYNAEQTADENYDEINEEEINELKNNDNNNNKRNKKDNVFCTCNVI